MADKCRVVILKRICVPGMRTCWSLKTIKNHHERFRNNKPNHMILNSKLVLWIKKIYHKTSVKRNCYHLRIVWAFVIHLRSSRQPRTSFRSLINALMDSQANQVKLFLFTMRKEEVLRFQIWSTNSKMRQSSTPCAKARRKWRKT